MAFLVIFWCLCCIVWSVFRLRTGFHVGLTGLIFRCLVCIVIVHMHFGNVLVWLADTLRGFKIYSNV